MGRLISAQDPDSLRAFWQDTTQGDSARIEAYESYIWNGYLFSRPDSAIMLAEVLHRFAQEHNYPVAASKGYNLQGIANAIQGNYPGALAQFEKSLAIDEKLNDKVGVATMLVNIGSIYKEKDDQARALEYYSKALPAFEQLGDKRGISATLNNIGGIYSSQGDTTRALEYYEKSKVIAEEAGDKQGVAKCLSNIGIINDNQGNPSRALEYLEKAVAISKEIGDQELLTFCLTYMGHVYNSLGKHLLAADYCQKSLGMAEEIGLPDQQLESCECLYTSYKARGNDAQALQYLEKMRVVEKNLDGEESTRILEQMEFAKVMFKDSVAKAEESRQVREAHQAEVRKKNATRNMLLGSALLLLVVAGGLYSRWRYVSKSRDIISKERDRSENLLLNILPAEIAEELKTKGRAEARDFNMVSILFSDFKGFTEASANLTAQDLVAEINACFEGFDGIMARCGIEKIKTIGDAYMAAGGLPVPTSDSTKNTVRAALQMQAFILKRKAQNEAQGKPAFEMRAGIHTGPVVAGIVGVKKFQYDIWGDTVNMASRMETNGEIGKVNISQYTYDLLKDDPEFRFEYRGKVEAKGKGAVDMWFVTQHTNTVDAAPQFMKPMS